MSRKIVSGAITFLIILLLAYAGFSKVMDISGFHEQMLRQPFPEWMAVLLTWWLPSLELITAGLLFFHRTKLWGMYLALALMSAFTLYTALALSGAFGSIPCACGGILPSLQWRGHLVLNTVCTLLVIWGILAERQKIQLKTIK